MCSKNHFWFSSKMESTGHLKAGNDSPLSTFFIFITVIFQKIKHIVLILLAMYVHQRFLSETAECLNIVISV